MKEKVKEKEKEREWNRRGCRRESESVSTIGRNREGNDPYVHLSMEKENRQITTKKRRGKIRDKGEEKRWR